MQKKSVCSMNSFFRDMKAVVSAKRSLVYPLSIITFAVKSFVDVAKNCDMSKYEFAIRETRTEEIIHDVRTMRSEIGVLYLSSFNRKIHGKASEVC